MLLLHTSFFTLCLSYNPRTAPKESLRHDQTTRRAFVPAFFVPVFVGSKVLAVLPDYDDYIGKSPKLPPGNPKPQIRQTAAVAAIQSYDDLTIVLRDAEVAAERLTPVVTKADWDAVLARLSESPLILLTKPIKLSIKPVLKDALEDASQALRELRDYAFENRIIYFNKADLNEVDRLVKETGFIERVDTSEALELLRVLQSELRKCERSQSS